MFWSGVRIGLMLTITDPNNVTTKEALLLARIAFFVGVAGAMTH